MKTMLFATTLLLAAGCGTEPGLFRADGARAVQGSGLDEGLEEREAEAPTREEAAAEREAPPADEARSGPTGEYRGYFCSEQLFILTQDITEAEALANCQLNAASNPDRSVSCTWNGQVIFVNELTAGACDVLPEGGVERPIEERGDEQGRDARTDEERGDEQGRDARTDEGRGDEQGRDARIDEESARQQQVCGLFRGGLDEATNMIASPNLPESVEDTDEACSAYCDASVAELGDLCVRGGIVIKIYSEAADRTEQVERTERV